MRLKEPGVGELFVEEEDGEADGAVGAEDQGLFDVGGFGGAGDEGGEAVGGDGGFEEGDAVVSLVHVGDDIAAVDDEGEVLGDKGKRAMEHLRFGNPAGAVFGYAEMGRKDGEVDVFECVRVFAGGRRFSKWLDLRAVGDDAFRRRKFFMQDGAYARKPGNSVGFAADRLQYGDKLSVEVGGHGRTLGAFGGGCGGRKGRQFAWSGLVGCNG